MLVGNLEVYGVIYKITNKVNGKIYIGQTKQGFDKRYSYKGKDIERLYNYYKSLKKHNQRYNEHLLRAIETYGVNNFYINKIFDVSFSKKELDIKEIHYINLFNSFNDKYGYNKTKGGDGGLGIKGCLNVRSREIVQLDLYGNVIAKWKCISDFDKSSAKHISSCCRGERKTCNNSRWMYTEDYYNNIDLIKPVERKSDSKPAKIIQLTLDGLFIKEWSSISNADRGTGISFKNISAVCRGKRKNAGGFSWMYYKEYMKLQEAI